MERLPLTPCMNLKKRGKKEEKSRAGLSEWQKTLKILRKCSGRDISLWIFEGIIMLLVVSFLFYDSFLVALLLSPYLVMYLRRKALEKNSKERRQLVTQFKDGMVAVSFALNAGYSIENSFREAVKELMTLYGSQSAIVVCFEKMLRRIKNNENIEDVLSEFAIKTQIEDIMYFADVFGYAKRSGGDLISIIKNTASTIRDKIEVDAQIQTAISGKKMESAVMAVMPFGILGYMKLSSPEFIDALYHNVIGVIFMSVCLVIIGCMNVVARRIVNIEI